ncbi:GGDEF domain-containing protein [Cellulomonas sp. NPDC089187]|uniref:GGDEF domain-containing protein n=1 Tax=Cellulomonas sp. NPDC089187 TaxID=3154970 RepID=UPI00342151EA
MSAPHRQGSSTRRPDDPTSAAIRRVLVVCLGVGLVTLVVVAALRWSDPVTRGAFPALGLVIGVFGWLVLRHPSAVVVASRLVLIVLDAGWLVMLGLRLALPPERGGGWDELFPTVFMGLVLFLVIGYVIFDTRQAGLHAAVVILVILAVGSGALIGQPQHRHHVLDLVRYGIYLGVLTAMLHVLSRSKEQATRALQAARYASAEAASMREMAYRDPLTGAANRRRLDDELVYQARLVASGIPVALVYLDLDHFKQINDAYGHETGDRVLATVATVLERGLRSGDVVARLGGEEFVAVAPGLDRAAAAQTAERLRRALTEAVAAQVGVQVTASVGVTMVRPGESPQAVIARADALMYRAKRDGRNRVVADTAPSEE